MTAAAVVPTLLLAALGAVTLLHLRPASPGPRPGAGGAVLGIQPGALAPGFSLRSLDGSSVDLAALRGRSVAVAFWASWCIPCRDEMAVFQGYAVAHPGAGILLVDVGDDPISARSFLAGLGVQRDLYSRVLPDPDARVAGAYGVLALPVTVFVGPDGRVTDRHIGSVNQQTLASHLAGA